MKKSKSKSDSFLVEFSRSEIRDLEGTFEVVIEPKKRVNRLFLYQSDSRGTKIGTNRHKALSFSNAYLAVLYLARNTTSRNLRSFARVERVAGSHC